MSTKHKQMYLYIDAEGNIKMDKASVMLVPEFKEMVDSKLFGWNFFQYTCLFTSRTPFGMLADEIRNQKVVAIVQSSPLNQVSSIAVNNFYKHEKFKEVSDLLKELHPDDVYDAYLTVSKKINQLIVRIEKLDIGENIENEELAENLVYLEQFHKNLKSLQDQKRQYEIMMRERTTVIRADQKAGSIRKELERKKAK